jgi:glucosamine kinase
VTNALVIGVDAGATSTRVSVHRLDGSRVGYGRAGAGNPTAHGVPKAAAAIGEALARALDGLDAARVAASHAGVAGLTAGRFDEFESELARLWSVHGVTGPLEITGDVVTAYAAGSPEPDGTMLLSGTGAIAGRIVGYRLDATADGLGWLLGDAGSGFWIGRAAASRVVDALDRGLPAGLLGDLVAGHFLGQEREAAPRLTAARIIQLAQADHMRLAALSVLVGQAASAGDPMAVEITREAAAHLVETVRRVRVGGPVVLAGSVLTNPGPVRRRVEELLGASVPVRTAGDAAGAAAWLSAREGLGASAAEAHARFVASPS